MVTDCPSKELHEEVEWDSVQDTATEQRLWSKAACQQVLSASSVA